MTDRPDLVAIGPQEVSVKGILAAGTVIGPQEVSVKRILATGTVIGNKDGVSLIERLLPLSEDPHRVPALRLMKSYNLYCDAISIIYRLNA